MKRPGGYIVRRMSKIRGFIVEVMIRLIFCTAEVKKNFRDCIVVVVVRKLRSFTFDVGGKMIFCTVDAVKMLIS
jgi:hypothetical protein